jgi:hypothetical protein
MDALTLEDYQEFSGRAAAVGRAMCPAELRLGGTGSTIPATIAEPQRLGVLVDGGGIDEGELIARILKADLSTRPAEQIILEWRRPGATTWQPTRWWVANVKDHPHEVEWVLTCVPKA